MLCLFILSFGVLPAVLGVSPVVAVMAYSIALNPGLISLSPQPLAVVLAGSLTTGLPVPPFTGIALIMSGLSQRFPFAIIRENWLFTAVMVMLLTAVPVLQK